MNRERHHGITMRAVELPTRMPIAEAGVYMAAILRMGSSWHASVGIYV